MLYDDDGREDGTIGFAKDLREILHKDQLATLGEVAIGLSHEINNPLAVIVNQTELLESDIARLADELDCSVENERLDAIRREVGRISEIVERLGAMVKSDTYETINYVGPGRARRRHLQKARRPGSPASHDRRISRKSLNPGAYASSRGRVDWVEVCTGSALWPDIASLR
jgi:light-regulated signal transduction histidine kinase (bacteriophytochrome)